MELSLCGVPLRLVCGTASEEAALARVLDSLFHLTPPVPFTGGSGIEMRFDESPEGALAGDPVFQAPDLESFRTTRGYHLRSHGSFLSLDLAGGRATGSLSAAFLGSAPENQRGLILIALLMLLSARGLYPLHAAGVVSPDGRGVLLAGRSGSGKTTLCCALARSGWAYLSDDAVLLKQGTSGVEAVAFGRPFHCSAAMFRHFPELGGRNVAPLRAKRLVEMASLYPGRFRGVLTPRAVLFPEIVSEPRSRVLPLSRAETLLRLLRDGAGVLHDRASTAAQTALLAGISQAAAGFRLLHGADVHSDPARLSALLQRLAGLWGEHTDDVSSAA